MLLHIKTLLKRRFLYLVVRINLFTLIKQEPLQRSQLFKEYVDHLSPLLTQGKDKRTMKKNDTI